MPNALPRHPVAPADIPEPYRSLLVHDHDMTSTLAAHHNSSIDLKPLEMTHENGVVTRTVLLTAADNSARPIEYGSITIHLDPFPPNARDLILAAERPLGWIIETLGVVYQCDPFLFFWIDADPALRDLMQTERTRLYGRLNRITSPDGDCLADVLEILP